MICNWSNEITMKICCFFMGKKKKPFSRERISLEEPMFKTMTVCLKDIDIQQQIYKINNEI